MKKPSTSIIFHVYSCKDLLKTRLKLRKKSEGLTTHQRAAPSPRAACRPACIGRRDRHAAAVLRPKCDKVSHSKALRHLETDMLSLSFSIIVQLSSLLPFIMILVSFKRLFKCLYVLLFICFCLCNRLHETDKLPSILCNRLQMQFLNVRFWAKKSLPLLSFTIFRHCEKSSHTNRKMDFKK